MLSKFKNLNFRRGFSYLEIIIGVFLFVVVALSVYRAFVTVLMVVKNSEAKTTAMLLANEEIEVARNLPYKDVGIVGGVPNGLIDRYSSVVRNGMVFNLTRSVSNIDDPFDGTRGGSPNDTAPADYKQFMVQVGCTNCKENFPTTTVVTTIAPKNLENVSNGGNLFIKVFDSLGQPVPQANVHIGNASLTPAISLDETTDNNGVFQLVDTPPAAQSYQITVSKSGFSTTKTYPEKDSTVYNPIDPNLTVSLGQVTQKSMSIDRLGQMRVASLNKTCSSLGNFSFKLRGSKTLGTNIAGSNIYKFDNSYQTDSAGGRIISNLEWDDYSIISTDNSRELAGIMPLLPVSLAAGAVQDVTLVLTNKSTNSFLVAVKDRITGQPIDGAVVTLKGKTLTTSRGSFNQTDWSGGGGQTLYSDTTRFYDSDGNIDYASAGQLKLRQSLGSYVGNGYLTSSIFDTGTSSTIYDSVSWEPQAQPVSAGTDPVRLQIASSDDPATTTWEFIGPDGTGATYFTTDSSSVHANSNQKRYIRYRTYLSTADNKVTPIVSDVAITYSSACTPFGQVLFQNLTTGSTTLSVSKSGYQTYSDTVGVVSGWQAGSVYLSH